MHTHTQAQVNASMRLKTPTYTYTHIRLRGHTHAHIDTDTHTNELVGPHTDDLTRQGRMSLAWPEPQTNKFNKDISDTTKSGTTIPEHKKR